MTLNYPIKLINLHSKDAVVESIQKTGLKCTVNEISPVEYNLVITSDDDLSYDDVLLLGSLIGSIQTEILIN